MTCAQGLLRLLWGGPEVGVLRDCVYGIGGIETESKMMMAPEWWLFSLLQK